MNEYEGHWITTYTGKKFHYLHPIVDEVDLKDIAHALSLMCRFGGHCREFYSVAQHSVLVAELVPDHLELQALLHDAAEAYLPDIPSPIKADLQIYKRLEKDIMYCIAQKFNISPLEDDTVKHADLIMLATEARDLMTNTTDWAELPAPRFRKVIPWDSDLAQSVFYSIVKGKIN